MAIVEEELGAPIAGIFDQFDYEPIAAASLGNQSFIFFCICNRNCTIKARNLVKCTYVLRVMFAWKKGKMNYLFPMQVRFIVRN